MFSRNKSYPDQKLGVTSIIPTERLNTLPPGEHVATKSHHRAAEIMTDTKTMGSMGCQKYTTGFLKKKVLESWRLHRNISKMAYII